MKEKIRLVGWYWGTTKLHNFKNVSQWFYDDEKSEHIYKNLGVMCMDNFGDLFLVGENVRNLDYVAVDAYNMADAMLKAREAK